MESYPSPLNAVRVDENENSEMWVDCDSDTEQSYLLMDEDNDGPRNVESNLNDTDVENEYVPKPKRNKLSVVQEFKSHFPEDAEEFLNLLSNLRFEYNLPDTTAVGIFSSLTNYFVSKIPEKMSCTVNSNAKSFMEYLSKCSAHVRHSNTCVDLLISQNPIATISVHSDRFSSKNINYGFLPLNSYIELLMTNLDFVKYIDQPMTERGILFNGFSEELLVEISFDDFTITSKKHDHRNKLFAVYASLVNIPKEHRSKRVAIFQLLLINR